MQFGIDVLMQVLMQKVPDLVLQLDAEFDIIKLNKPAEHFFNHFGLSLQHDFFQTFQIKGSTLNDVVESLNNQQYWNGELFINVNENEKTLTTELYCIKQEEPKFDKLVLCVLAAPDMPTSTEAFTASRILEDFSRQLPGVLYQYKLNVDGSIEMPYLSSKAKEVFGYTPEEIQINPKLLHEALHPDDKQKFWDNIMESAASLTDFRFEYRILINNQIEWMFANSTPKKMRDGSILWIGYTKKITERKQNELRLKESETKFRTLIENSPNLIFTHTLDGKINFISDYALRILQVDDVDAFKAQNIFSIVHPDDMPKVLATLAKIAKVKQTMTSEPFRINIEDRYEWVIVTGAPILDENGEIIEILSIGTIITSLKEKEEALIKSEALARKMANFYQSLLNSQSIYVVKTDAEGNFVYVNDCYQNIFGADVALVGTNALDSVYVEDRENVKSVVALCLAQPEKAHNIVLRKVNFAGQIVTSQWEFTAKTNAKGEVEEILCIGHDISELMSVLKKTEELLEVTTDQNSRLQNFAYIVSHNIRSHSANLMGIAQMMEEAKDDNDRHLFLEMLKTSTQRLEETIQNLNEIITIQRSANQPKTKLNLFKEVEKAIDVLSEAIHDGHAVLDINVPRNLFIKGIPAYVDSILLNVVSNAYKYRSPNRKCTINIKATEMEEFVCLEISDNGLGIDMKKAKGKLFGMYKTFHQVPDAKGLGLFMTKNQIEAMGGKIELKSVLDQGTTVLLYFRKY
jgi:PAS domain S-box-containing protein